MASVMVSGGWWGDPVADTSVIPRTVTTGRVQGLPKYFKALPVVGFFFIVLSFQIARARVSIPSSINRFLRHGIITPI